MFLRKPQISSTRSLQSHYDARFFLSVIFVLLILSCSPETGAQPADGAIGLGGQIGDPSGISLRLTRARTFDLDFLAAWDLDDFFFLNVHGLRTRAIQPGSDVELFYGPGAFIGFRDHPHDREDDIVIGASATVGLSLFLDQLELFVQLTPRLSVVPDTDGDIGGGVGLRYWL
jgi:hypothetical protein